MAEQTIPNLDIKDFQSISSAQKLDSILMVLSNGLGAKVTIDLLIKILLRDIQPSINEAGEWVIGTNLTGQIAVGKSPFLQTSENGIEWKYEDETSFRPLVSYDQLKLKFTDMTPEQIQMLVGGKGEKGETGDVGPTGETGKSAYTIAVERGYTGTEQQFGEEQAAIAANSARLTGVENNKANLINGIIPSDEIAQLQGRQTGVSLKGTAWYGKETIFDSEYNFGRNSFSMECYIDYDRSPSTSATSTYGMLAIRDQFNREILSFYRQHDGFVSIYLNSRRADNTYEQIGLAFLMVPGVNHVVLTMDRQNKILTGYCNGEKFNQVPFKEEISNTTLEKLLIGDNNINNQSPMFIAKQWRIFNYVLSEPEAMKLYNYGRPWDFSLDYKLNAESENRCIFEYLPSGINLNTWKETIQGLDLISGGTKSNIMINYEKRSLSPLAPLFIARGAVFNINTGYYELNGLTDITEAQMIGIYTRSNGLMGGDWSGAFYASSVRTNFKSPQLDSWITAKETFRNTDEIEVIKISGRYGVEISPKIINGELMFFQSKVKRITDYVDCALLTNAKNMFTRCTNLESVNLTGLSISLSIAESSLLNVINIRYLITNARNKSQITVTLHPTAKARLTEEDIALAVSKNITIA